MHTGELWSQTLNGSDIVYCFIGYYTGWAKKPDHFLKCITFYSASALLAMQSAVLARGILSVCLSVCPSVLPSRSGIVSRRIQYNTIQINEDTIVRFSASGRTISLVSGEVKFIRIFVGDHPQRGGGLKWGTPLSIGKIRPIIGHNLETAQDRR